MTVSPYLLPPGNVQIAFSGGRTSAFMLHEILRANGGIPDRVVVTFQNTGREMNETLDFVAEVGSRWGISIVWLEYRAYKPLFERVHHNNASRDGQPFEALIRKKRYLPNQRQRFCTQELKVLTSKRYLRSLGWDRWSSAIGIRSDEPKRIKPSRDRWVNWYPMAEAGVDKAKVLRFWDAQPFDLKLPVVDNCTLGNCDGCMLKAEISIASLHHHFPDRALWWERMEDLVTELTTSESPARFSKRYSRADMRTYMERKGHKVLSSEGELCQKDEGECLAY